MTSRPAPRRSFGALVCALVAVVALIACGDNAGDPGNRRLNALQADPALKLVPPGLRSFGQSSTSAEKPPFSDFYNGPGVTKSFRFTEPVEQALPRVLEYYSAELPRLGWVFVRKESQPPRPGLEIATVSLLYSKEVATWKETLSISPGLDHRRTRDPLEPAVFVSLDAPPAR